MGQGVKSIRPRIPPPPQRNNIAHLFEIIVHLADRECIRRFPATCRKLHCNFTQYRQHNSRAATIRRRYAALLCQRGRFELGPGDSRCELMRPTLRTIGVAKARRGGKGPKHAAAFTTLGVEPMDFRSDLH